MDYTVSLQVQHQLKVFPTHLYQDYSLELQMKSTEVEQELFTDSYCKVCSAQLISESQRVAHYESRKHANKVRLFYMLHPVDGGLSCEETPDGQRKRGRRCGQEQMLHALQHVVYISSGGAVSLPGKNPRQEAKATARGAACHNKRGAPSPVKTPEVMPAVTSPRERRDSDRYCQLCNAWFNNPGMAQQHYDGKKHKKNAARADLLEQLGKTIDLGELKALKRSYTCDVCSVTLNSVDQYHAHLQGSKHQNNLKNLL